MLESWFVLAEKLDIFPSKVLLEVHGQRFIRLAYGNLFPYPRSDDINSKNLTLGHISGRQVLPPLRHPCSPEIQIVLILKTQGTY